MFGFHSKSKGFLNFRFLYLSAQFLSISDLVNEVVKVVMTTKEAQEAIDCMVSITETLNLGFGVL